MVLERNNKPHTGLISRSQWPGGLWHNLFKSRAGFLNPVCRSVLAFYPKLSSTLHQLHLFIPHICQAKMPIFLPIFREHRSMLMNLSSRMIGFKEKTKVKTTIRGIYISWQTNKRWCEGQVYIFQSWIGVISSLLHDCLSAEMLFMEKF